MVTKALANAVRLCHGVPSAFNRELLKAIGPEPRTLAQKTRHTQIARHRCWEQDIRPRKLNTGPEHQTQAQNSHARPESKMQAQRLNAKLIKYSSSEGMRKAQ